MPAIRRCDRLAAGFRPSLLGLIPEFDVQGEDVYAVYKKIKALSEE